jgi:putative ABC transport system permease protein
MMIRNYIKIAFRNLFKDRFYSLLNILGLSIGIATSMLIMLFIVDELGYDKFHESAHNIYRIITKGKLGDEQVMHVAVTGAPLAEVVKTHIPEVESITRLQPRSLVFMHEGESIKEEKLLFADSSFYDVFSFPLLEGRKENALTEPMSIVMTEETAVRYYGSKAVERGEVVGQLLKAGNDTYKITGIMGNVPENSHFDFDMLISMSSQPDASNPIFINMNYYTYVRMAEGIVPEKLEGKLRDLVRQYVIPQVIAYLHFPEVEYTDELLDENFKYELQPLTDIHLRSNLHAELGTNSDMQYVYIFSVIAIFIILIACINFMNLATARSAKRAREVGIRKTLGSTRNPLIRQFLFESLLFIIIAMLIALGMTEAFRMPFNMISGKNLTFNIFQDPWIILLILGIILVVTMIAGSYPAFYLTRFKPVDVLKGTLHSGSKGSIFRSSLVIFQFIISIGLIVCTILVYKQMNFIRNKNLGFDKENVIILKNANNLGDRKEMVKQNIENIDQVISTSYTTHVPSNLYWSSAHKAEGDLESDHIVFMSLVDYDFQKTLQLEMEHGRFFSRDYPSDSSAVIINEAAAYIFGWTEDNGGEAIGQRIETINTMEGGRVKYEVIGVVRNFNFETLKNEVRPMAMYLNPGGSLLTVRVGPGNPQEALNSIRSVWVGQAPWAPFEYNFLDDQFNQMFDREERLGAVFTVFTFLAIMVACLGLFGLAAYTAEQRTKEIGIRKVMGASTSNVVGMLTREFTRLVLISFILAMPIAWFFMNEWLKAFAYKTEIGVWPFLAAGSVAVVISWLTVSYQSVRAAKANPVNSLRSE